MRISDWSSDVCSSDLEVAAVLFAFEDRGDLGEVVQPLHEGVGDRLAEAAGEGHELPRRQLLLAEEHPKMVEEPLADSADPIDRARRRPVGPGAPGPDRTRARRAGNGRFSHAPTR